MSETNRLLKAGLADYLSAAVPDDTHLGPEVQAKLAKRARPLPRRPWRVVISHVRAFHDHPAGRSYVDAAFSAVSRAGHAVRDMRYLPASPSDPAELCREMVRTADVYVGLIGRWYGSIVPEQAHLSYTELEFETATDVGMPRLVFLIDAAGDPSPRRQPSGHAARQAAFRRRLQEQAGVTIATVNTPADLEMALFHALTALNAELGPRYLK